MKSLWCRLSLLALSLILSATAACIGGRPPVTATLHVLASSELGDMQPLLGDLRRDTGVELVMDYRGTVDASNALTPGEYHHDLAWLSSDRYFRLKLKKAGYSGTTPLSTITMISPVAIGVKPKTGDLLRRTTGDTQFSWADIANRAAEGLLRFGMANPKQTNSGLAALIGVATSAADKGGALDPEDITCDRLRGFFTGQVLTADTSRQLIDDYIKHQDDVDALITYESLLLSLNESGKLRERLQIIYPRDGMVLSDYPLLLLNPTQRAAYDRVVEWLRSAPVQKRIMQLTRRRPIDPEVARDPQLQAATGNTLYFPDDQTVVDRLLADFDDPRFRKPDHVVFVLDFSKSMQGGRISALRSVFVGPSGVDNSSSDSVVRFYNGEELTIMRFAGRILDEKDFTVGSQQGQDPIRDFVAADDFGDGTATWSALDHAYQKISDIVRLNPHQSVSVVLMTDGVNNAGMGAEEFLRDYASLPSETRAARTFTVRLGEADPGELDRVARATGGHMVDATPQSLLDMFKEIRGCH